MKNTGKTIAITLGSIIIILAIVVVVCAYLFIATDLFKSDRELFSKYAIQNIDALKQLTDSKTIQVYKDLENNNCYESLTTVDFEHSEGGEISNPLNELALEVKTQKNEKDKYYYADAQVLFEDERYLEAELIREENLVGIRFSDVIKEFLTIRDDENLETVAEALGVSIEQLQTLMQVLQDEENIIISEDEVNQITQKYTNILTNSITNASFSNFKKSTITVNGKTTEANGYSAYFNNEQTRQIIIDILNNIKQDEQILSKIKEFIPSEELEQKINLVINNISKQENIPEIKITVYEQNGKTVQTVIEINQYKIVIENIKNENQVDIKIIIKDNSEKEQIVQITKEVTENNENYKVAMKFENRDQEIEINITSEMKKDEENIDTDIRIEYIEGITIIAAETKNKVTSTQQIEDKQVLDNSNNVILNDINKQTLTNAMELFKTNLNTTTMESITQLKEKLSIGNEQLQENESNSQIEINKFNAQFEFYTGDGVSAENVKTLLEMLKTHLNNVEYMQQEPNADEEMLNIKLYVEKGKENTEIINSVLEKVKDENNYKVSISYKENNGMIDYIVIEEIEEE